MAEEVQITQSVINWGKAHKASERAQARTIVPLLDMWDDMNKSGRTVKDGQNTRTWTKATITAISDKTDISYGTVERHLKEANRLKLDLSPGWEISGKEDKSGKTTRTVRYAAKAADLDNRDNWVIWDRGSARGLITHLAAILDKPANNGNTPKSDKSDNPPETGKSGDTDKSGKTPESGESGKTDNPPESGKSDGPAKADKADKTAIEAVIGAIETIRANFTNLDKSDKAVAIGAIAALVEDWGLSVSEGRLRP